MSRRRAALKREILPDPKYGSELVTKFINHVMVDGKKSISEKIVYGALEIAAQKLKGKVQDTVGEGETTGSGGVLGIFSKVIEILSPTVEVRSRRVGGSTYQVPVEVRSSRKTTLAMRWLVEAAKKRSEKTMAERLGAEIIDAINGRGNSIKKREDVHKMAMANQAFAHYRW